MTVSGRAPSAGEISARIDRLPPTRTVWAAILLLSAGMFFELYDLLFTAYIAPTLVKSGLLAPTTSSFFGLSGVAGFIAALFTGLFIGTIACGFLSDRFGRRTVFVGSLLWYTVANIMVALQNDAFGLNVWRFISGLGLGVEMVTIGAYLSEMAPKASARPGVRLFAGDRLLLRADLVVPRLRCSFRWRRSALAGWRWVVLIGALAAALIGFLRFGLPESPRWLARQGRLEEADRVLERDRSTGRERIRRAAAGAGAGRADLARRRVSRTCGRRRSVGRVILMSVFNIFQTVGFYGFQNWVPTLLVAQGVEITKSLGYTTVIALAAPVGPLIGFFRRRQGSSANRHRRRRPARSSSSA